MPEDETTQELVEETTQTTVEPTTPDAPGATAESATEGTESSEEGTESQIEARLAETEKKFKQLEAEFTQRSQRNAELERMNKQYEQALKGMLGEQEAQRDPLVAARQKLLAAQTEFDPEKTTAAMDEYIALREQRLAQQVLAQSLNAQKTVQALERAKRFGDFTPEELTNTGQSLTAEELAMITRHRKGDLLDVLSKQKEEREANAQRAQYLNTIAGEGSPGMVPGRFGAQPNAPLVHWVIWNQWNRESKEEFAKAGGRVHGIPGGASDVPDEMRI